MTWITRKKITRESVFTCAMVAYPRATSMFFGNLPLLYLRGQLWSPIFPVAENMRSIHALLATHGLIGRRRRRKRRWFTDRCGPEGIYTHTHARPMLCCHRKKRFGKLRNEMQGWLLQRGIEDTRHPDDACVKCHDRVYVVSFFSLSRNPGSFSHTKKDFEKVVQYELNLIEDIRVDKSKDYQFIVE